MINKHTINNLFSEQGAAYDDAYEDEDEGDTDIGEHKSVIMSLLGENLDVSNVHFILHPIYPIKTLN